jgi:hypothetical protein
MATPKSPSSGVKRLLERMVGDGRARDLERLDGVGGGAFQRELQQYSTDETRELKGVARAYRHRDLRMLRQRVKNEVLVRRDGVRARPGVVEGELFYSSPSPPLGREPTCGQDVRTLAGSSLSQTQLMW